MTKNFNISDLQEYLNEDILLKYIKNELSEEDIEKVEFLLQNDQIYSDIFDGLLMLDNPEDVISEKFELNKKVDAFSRNIKRQKERRYLKFRSVFAIILLIIISIIIFLIITNINKDSAYYITAPEKSGNDYHEIFYLEEKNNAYEKNTSVDTLTTQELTLKISGFIITGEENLYKEKLNESDQNYFESVISDSVVSEDYMKVDIEEKLIEFVVIEEDKKFPGGEDALFRYITENIKYPENAKKHGKEGTVHIRFAVQNSGKVTDIEVIKGIDPELDREAMRVIENMPSWSQDRAGEKSKSQSFTISIRFKLE